MEDAPKLIVPYGPRVAWLCTSHVMSSCHYAAKDPRQLKREQVIIQLIIVLNFVMIDEDMFKDITAAKARFDLSLARSQEKPVRIIYGLLLALLLVVLPWVGGAKPKL